MSIEHSWEILSQDTVLDTPWIRVFKKNFRLPNGKEIKDYFVIEKPDVVVIIVLNEQNETYLIKEWERGTEQIGFKFPAGRINKDEIPTLAASREFEEELGLSIDNPEFTYLGSTDVEPGLMTTQAHYFLTRISGGIIDESKREDTEIFIGSWVPWHNVYDLIKQHEIRNPFVIIGALLAESYLRNI